MIDPSLILESEMLLLRPIKSSDLEKYMAMSDDQSMWKYFTSDLSVADELKKWVADSILQTENGSRVAFTIVDKKSGKIAGSTSLGNISFHDKRIEIGWTWLGKEFQGMGINRESKYLLLQYCFDVLEFERVECKTDVLNIPARKALQGIGMTEEGVLRSHTLMTHSRRRDTIYFSILKNEWPLIKSRNKWH